MPAPDLDLDARPRATAKSAKPKREVIEDAPLELAIDPRSLVQERAAEQPAPIHRGLQPAPPAPLAATNQSRLKPASLPPPGTDLEMDAFALADYGDPPGTPVLAPLYAWKVFKRQRELKAALAVRTAEAAHAKTTLEDALVALAERVRPVAEKQQGYLQTLEELTRAEDLLRSRDKVLAAEQDAQRGRLAQVDGRIGKAEQELANAQGHERAVATELSGAQGALAREEAKIKRAEAELRAAQQRESGAMPTPR
jgi:hypothetical protein